VRRFCCAALAAQALLPTAPVRAEPQDSAWQFALTPYLWLPYISSSLSFETPGTGGSADLKDYLKNLNAALFVSGEARHGNWTLAFDLVYCDFSDENSKVTSVVGPGGMVDVPVNSDTRTGLTAWMLSLTGGYSVVRQSERTLDVLAGLRFTHVGATLGWDFQTSVDGLPGRTGSVSQGVDLWDGVVGLRGRVLFGGGKWFVPYYLDAGAGTSKFTWQALAGVGYSFGWGDLLLAYRYLSFEQASDTALIQRLTLYGPALGATFRF
jgi:opacity protein-like surface antigen